MLSRIMRAYWVMSQSGSCPVAVFNGRSMFGIAQIGKENIIHLQIAAARIIKGLHRLFIGFDQIIHQQFNILIGGVANICDIGSEMTAAGPRN